jgi:hypothetical protein
MFNSLSMLHPLPKYLGGGGGGGGEGVMASISFNYVEMGISDDGVEQGSESPRC